MEWSLFCCLSCSRINIYLLSCYSISRKLTSGLFSIVFFSYNSLNSAGSMSFCLMKSYSFFSWTSSLLLYFWINFLYSRFWRSASSLASITLLFYYFNLVISYYLRCLLCSSYCFKSRSYFSAYLRLRYSASFFWFLRLRTSYLACLLNSSYSRFFYFLFLVASSMTSPLILAIYWSNFLSSSIIFFF